VLGVTPPGAGATAAPPGSTPNGPAEGTGAAIGRILIATDGRTVQEVPLKVGRIIVGRTTDNDVQIDSRFVSRHHCQVITTPHACVIEDLNSTNGIYVKSKRVRRHYLNDGDVVQLGKHELIYIDERLPRVRAPFVETVPGAPPAEPVGETH
jgi:pSer/pThr/pTyr-binding forkhead associated (FHA) protein